MDSGSWFAIWAICLRTSFFVMIPRSLLEKKQNREKGSDSQSWPVPVPNPQHPFHPGTRRDNISQPPLRMGGSNWVSSGQWRVGGGERYPSRVTCTSPLSPHLPARDRGASEGRWGHRGLNPEPPDSKTWVLEWLCGAKPTPAATHTGCEWHGRKINLYCVRPLRLQACLLQQ